MAQVPLPQTLGRLSQSCDIFATTGGNVSLAGTFDSFLSSNDMQSSSGVDPLSFLSSLSAILSTTKPLGSVEKLEISQIREVERIYGIGAYAFEPQRIVPKAIRTSLTLHKVMLYNEDFLKSVGFNSYNIFYQQAPFIIKQTLVNPNPRTVFGQTDLGDPDVIIYFDCWITTNPMTFDLTANGANLVKQEIKVECGRVFVSSAQFLYGGVISKLTKKNIPFFK